MTVTTTTTKNSYSANGTLHSFAYGFKIFADGDLTVIVRSATGTETTKTLNTHYVVTNAGTDAGGNVLFKFNTGTSSDAHYSTTDYRPANNETVVILRSLTKSQGTDYVENDPFPSTSHEDALDRLTFIAQEVQEELDRTIKLSKTNTMTSPEFTTSAADRASKILAFDSNGELSVTQELGTYKGTSATTTIAAFVERDIVKGSTTAQLNNIYICVAASAIGDALTDTDHFAVLVDAVSAATSATTATTKASEAATSATNAAASYDSFDDRYLGAKGSDPSVDNDGASLITGALYFKTDGSGMKAYNGSAWEDVSPTDAEQTNINTVAGLSTEVAALSASAVVADMALLATTDVIADMALLATTDIIADMNTLATSAIVADLNILATTDIVADMALLATTDIVADMNALATSDIISDLNALATSDIITDMNLLATSEVIADMATLAGSGASPNITSLSTSGDVVVGDDLSLTSDAAVLNFGANSEVNLTHVHDTGLLLNGAMKLQFSDASQFIHAPSATVLDIAATDEIELTATLIDVVGNQTVSGTLGVTGVLTGTSLDISGDIDVDGTTNLDVVDVDGAVDFASTTAHAGNATFADNAKAIFGAGSDLQIYHDGSNSIIHDNGTGNLQIQADDFKVMNAAGDENIVFAAEDGTVRLFYNNASILSTTSTGIEVNGITVSDGMSTNTSGTSNFIAGVNAGNSIVSGGNYNTVVGDEAGTAISTGDYNTAVGYLTGAGVTTGIQNTLMGAGAGDVLDVGGYNVALGSFSLTTDTKGSKSIAVGHGALNAQNFTSATDTYNVAVGHQAGVAVTTGTFNTLIGGLAGDAITTGGQNTALGYQSLSGGVASYYNTAIGYQALLSDTTGRESVAVGRNALRTQNDTTSSSTYNTAVGANAGYAVTTGIQNTLIGGLAGDALTDADFNVAVGLASLSADTKGSKSTAIGVGALEVQNFTSSTDAQNTAVGYKAGAAVTTGTSNSFFGLSSGYSATTGPHNTCIGVEAGYANITGQSSTYIGRSCGVAATGDSNTFIGRSSGSQVTSGAKNTILGRYQGNSGGLDIRTASNYIVFSDGDGNPRGYFSGAAFHAGGGGISVNGVGASNSIHGLAASGAWALGLQQNTTSAGGGRVLGLRNVTDFNNASNEVISYNGNTTQRFLVLSNGNVTNTGNSYGAISDIKLKEQITDASSQWNDIKALTVRKYKMKDEVISKGDSDELWRLGVVAQEIETAGMNGLIEEIVDREENGEDSGTTTKTVKYSVLYMKAVKALQEAMTRIETLESKVATLEG